MPRTGTSILNALLKEQIDGWDLDERWKIKDSDEELPDIFNNLPHLNHQQQVRLKHLKENVNKRWIIKIWPQHFLLQKNIIDELLVDDVKLLMTNRKNVEDHFISWMNAYYRSRAFNQKMFQYTNKQSESPKYDSVGLSKEDIIVYFNTFKDSLIHWRLAYEIYKDKAVVISYEDEINLLNLKRVGITEETIKTYFNKETYYVPTPFNSKNVAEEDLYSQCTELLKNYRYLVEV
jgi:hypothetical protein